MGLNQILLFTGYIGMIIADLLSSFVIMIPYDVILMTGQWDLILIQLGMFIVIGIVMGIITRNALWGFIGSLLIMVFFSIMTYVVFMLVPMFGIPIDFNTFITGMTNRDSIMFFVTGTVENGVVAGLFGMLTGSIVNRGEKKDEFNIGMDELDDVTVF